MHVIVVLYTGPTAYITIINDDDGTAHIIHVFLEFQQYQAGALKCLAQEYTHKKNQRTPGLRVKHYH